MYYSLHSQCTNRYIYITNKENYSNYSLDAELCFLKYNVNDKLTLHMTSSAVELPDHVEPL